MNEPHGGDACSQTAELQMIRHFIPDSRTWLFLSVDSGLPGDLGTVPALQVKVLESKYMLLKPREGSDYDNQADNQCWA